MPESTDKRNIKGERGWILKVYLPSHTIRDESLPSFASSSNRMPSEQNRSEDISPTIGTPSSSMGNQSSIIRCRRFNHVMYATVQSKLKV